MDTVTSRHWAQIGEVTFIFGIRLLFVVYRLLGRWPFRLLMFPTVLFYLVRYPLARASSHGYLSRLYRHMERDPREVTLWLSVKHVAVFAESILDKLRVWAGDVRPDEFVIHDHDVIDRETAAGRGGVIIVTHLGNAEACRALIARHPGVAMTVLVHTKHARSFNALLGRIDPASTLNLLQVTELTSETVIRLRKKVDHGEFVVIAGDRVPVSVRPRVASAEFLGEVACFPIGPYVLASLLQCPVFLLFCIVERGTFHVYFERFSSQIVIPRATRELALRRFVSDYADRLTHYCQLAPLQWFNFYDFWAMSHTIRFDVPR